MPAALGAPDALVRAAHTASELDDALTQAAKTSDRLVFIEARTDRDDAPDLLHKIAAGVRTRNSAQD